MRSNKDAALALMFFLLGLILLAFDLFLVISIIISSEQFITLMWTIVGGIFCTIFGYNMMRKYR